MNMRFNVIPLILLLFSVNAAATHVTLPYTFTAGQKIVASEMNSDFNAVTSVVNGAIDSTNIAVGGIATASIANNAVTTTAIIDGAVTANKLAANSVATSNIQDGSVTASKLTGLTTTNYAYAYHDSSCSWAVTSSSYVAPSADSSCKFEVLRLNGLSVVQQEQGNILPNMTVTNMPAGAYELCVSVANMCGTSGEHPLVKVTDGTSLTILELQRTVSLDSNGHDSSQLSTTCGIYNLAATASKTFTSLMRSDGAASNCPTVTAQGAATASIVWMLHSI